MASAYIASPRSYKSAYVLKEKGAQEPHVEVQIGSAIKGQEEWKKKYLSPKIVIIVGGIFLLSLLSIVPIWSAMSMLQDSNYVFWEGRWVPNTIITACISIIVFYGLTVYLFFKENRCANQTEHTMMMLASIFLTLYGVFLILISLPLTHQVNLTSTNLLHRCDISAQTHRLYEYSQVLHNIRASPACSKLYSVEECAGYQEAAPFTSLLKAMEDNYRCSGFCISGPVVLTGQGPDTAGLPRPCETPASLPPAYNRHYHPASLISEQSEGHAKGHAKQAFLGTEALQSGEHGEATSDSKWYPAGHFEPQWYPPTLFSDSNFKTSCEGMAARDLKNFAGDTTRMLFFYGVYLVMVSVVTAFLKLVGFCIPKS